ncbi:MAG TPA: helix-turn-helix transcriptional regulator [Longimicrobiales bacterium]|nr:helix-turn-helix transcriptional regulator [Longimicrobiales bacterium]
MRFRHLDYGADTPVVDLGPAAIDALLERGDLHDWAPVLRAIARAPWGRTAETVLRLCDAHPMYGTSDLWRAWIEGLRKEEEAEGESLAQARARAGLTQAEVGRRMGISQSDVSKLERRGDARVSTLRAYAQALGGQLRLSLELSRDAHPRPLLLGEPSARGG